jgi:hypothetical protein
VNIIEKVWSCKKVRRKEIDKRDLKSGLDGFALRGT